jgi:hypothetical protein
LRLLGQIAWASLLVACHQAGDAIEGPAPDAGDDDGGPVDTGSGVPLDCQGSGVWLDEEPALCWEESASEGMTDGWSAVTYCEDLSLAGYPDWRLPSVDDLRALVRGCGDTQTGGACTVEAGSPMEDCNEACEGCISGDGPAGGGCYWPAEIGGTCSSWYWSDSKLPENATFVWNVHFEDAAVGFMHKENMGLVRCVRAAD